MSKKYLVLLTQSSQSCWSNQLHQLVVAHISQQVLQASLSSECGEFVATAASAACRSRNGRVVQVLIHLTTVLFILVSLWLLVEMRQTRIPSDQINRLNSFRSIYVVTQDEEIKKIYI